MIEKGVYTVETVRIDVEEGMKPEAIFYNAKDKMTETNHVGKVVVIGNKEHEKNVPVTLSYDAVKKELRQNYNMHTIFPIVENTVEVLKPVGTFSTEYQWLCSSHEEKLYFHGDNPNIDVTPEKQKFEEVAIIPCIGETSKITNVYFIINGKEDKKFLEENVKYKDGISFFAKGMETWNRVGKNVTRNFFVSRAEIIEEDFSDIPKIVTKANKIHDVCVWTDLRNYNMIPSEVEAQIITGSLFFSYEGFAAINLLITGAPGCGKSFQLDVFAHLVDTECHNCAETTLKGLVFSHAEKGGSPGILYRERFVALLNEFIRIIGSSKKEAQKDAVRRLLTTLNDAVEKKKNRSRSSGYVQGASVSMVASMMSSENNYPHTMGPFAEALLNDASYMRRYAILLVSEETENRGRNVYKVPDWREAVQKMLLYRGLGHGKWYRLMRYMRAEAKNMLPKLSVENVMKIKNYAEETKDEKIRRMFLQEGQNELVIVPRSKEETVYAMLKEANFEQLSVACLCTSVVMNSVFRQKKEEFPVFEEKEEDVEQAKKMVNRLISDVFEMLRPYVEEEVGSGVLRVPGSFEGRKW